MQDIHILIVGLVLVIYLFDYLFLTDHDFNEKDDDDEP